VRAGRRFFHAGRSGFFGGTGPLTMKMNAAPVLTRTRALIDINERDAQRA
jgi:hypothetical protein